MTILNINSKLAWKSDFEISQVVIPFEKESIEELKSAVLQARVDPIGRVTGKIPPMPTLKKQFEEAKKKKLEVSNPVVSPLLPHLGDKQFA